MTKLPWIWPSWSDYDQAALVMIKLFLILIYLTKVMTKTDRAAIVSLQIVHDYDQGLGHDLQYSRFSCLHIMTRDKQLLVMI